MRPSQGQWGRRRGHEGEREEKEEELLKFRVRDSLVQESESIAKILVWSLRKICTLACGFTRQKKAICAAVKN